MSNERRKVGFIGLGVMGQAMASHIQNHGYPLFIYNRTKEKGKLLIEKGAIWCNTPKEVVENADVVFTILGFPEDVEEIYLGENGLITNGREGQFFIDMTTSSPSLAVKLYEEGKKKGIHVLDAPVSGGDIGAKEARLAIMVGGDKEAFESILPIFKTMGTNVVYQGQAGFGQHTKMANQIAIASNMMGVSEALIYAIKAGLDAELVLQTIETGAAGSFSLSKLGPRMLIEDYSPGFFIKHFIKDMKIALNEAEKMGLELPGLSLAKKLYESLAENGEENSGTQALIKYYR